MLYHIILCLGIDIFIFCRLKLILRKLPKGSFKINKVSLNRCPPYTEIFSKRRKICSVCVESLSMTVNCCNSCLNNSSKKSNLEHKGYGKTYKKSSLIDLKHQLLKYVFLFLFRISNHCNALLLASQSTAPSIARTFVQSLRDCRHHVETFQTFSSQLLAGKRFPFPPNLGELPVAGRCLC